MVKITRITTQKKNTHRYNIYLDEGTGEKYGFSVDEDILIKHHLRKGRQLTDDLINTLTDQDDLHKVYNQVIHYLSYRMRTEKEVRDYLQNKEVDEEKIEQIIDQLYQRRLLNDREFAEMFVRTRMSTSSKGPELIENELKAKGVASDIANDATEQFSFAEQIDKAFKIGQKRLSRSSNHSFQKQMDQAKAALIRNGFSSEVIQTVIDEVKDERDDDEEWAALEYHGEKLHKRFVGKLSEAEIRQKMKEGLYRQGFSLGFINQYLETRNEE